MTHVTLTDVYSKALRGLTARDQADFVEATAARMPYTSNL